MELPFKSDLFFLSQMFFCKEQMAFSGAKARAVISLLFFCGVSQIIISNTEAWHINFHADIWYPYGYRFTEAVAGGLPSFKMNCSLFQVKSQHNWQAG